MLSTLPSGVRLRQTQRAFDASEAAWHEEAERLAPSVAAQARVELFVVPG